MSTRTLKGDELQLWIDEIGASVYATSHTLTLTGNTVDVGTKDHGNWNASEIGNLTWEITAECLYTEGQFDDLFDMMVHKTFLSVSFAKVENYDENGRQRGGKTEGPEEWTVGVGKSGMCYVTTLAANANTGENATYSLTLTGAGPLINDDPTSNLRKPNMVNIDFSATKRQIIAHPTDKNLLTKVKMYNASTGEEIPLIYDQQSGNVIYNGPDTTNLNVLVYFKNGLIPVGWFNTSHVWEDNVYIDVPTIEAESCLEMIGTRIEFSKNVKSIGDNAFNVYDGDNIHALVFKGTTPPTFGRDICGNIANVTSVTVPTGTLQAYQTAWGDYGTTKWIEE